MQDLNKLFQREAAIEPTNSVIILRKKRNWSIRKVYTV